MMRGFAVHRLDFPLSRPYVLSFGTVTSFKSCFVSVTHQGRVGVGEITPLPGYSSETIESVERSVAEAARLLRVGTPWRDVVAGMDAEAPFAASGVACAFETWETGLEDAFGPVDGTVPLSAFCAGGTAEQAASQARELLAQGYATLKMKVGAMTPEQDARRISAVSAVLPAGGRIRLDANQGYTYDQALAMCRYLEDIEGIELLEQPFAPDAWALHERLAGATSVPIMLDESIWTEEHVRRAAACGARLVKFKLCKHPGLSGSRRVIAEARRLGLGIVYGNGVQGAVGNHLEIRVHAEAGLATASESNGFLKVAESPVPHRLRCVDGLLTSGGVSGVETVWESGRLVAEVQDIATAWA